MNVWGFLALIVGLVCLAFLIAWPFERDLRRLEERARQSHDFMRSREEDR